MAEQIQNIVGNVMSESENILNRALDNEYISTAIKIFLGLYAALAAPQLPKSLVSLLDNIFVRILFAFSIVFMATRDPSIALMIAVAFIVTLQTANKMRLYDTSLSIANPGDTSWLPSVKGEESGDGNIITDVAGKIEDAGIHVINDVANLGTHVVNDVANLGTHVVNDVANLGTHVINDVANLGTHVINDVKNVGTNLLDVIVPGDANSGVVESWKDAAPIESSNNGEFTSEANLNDACCNNTVPGSDQQSCVQTFSNQHCAQGLQSDVPNGMGGLVDQAY